MSQFQRILWLSPAHGDNPLCVMFHISQRGGAADMPKLTATVPLSNWLPAVKTRGRQAPGPSITWWAGRPVRQPCAQVLSSKTPKWHGPAGDVATVWRLLLSEGDRAAFGYLETLYAEVFGVPDASVAQATLTGEFPQSTALAECDHAA